MPYSLQAIVARSGAFASAPLPRGLRVVRLRGDIDMIPLDTAFRNAHAIPFCPLTDGGDTVLPPALLSLCEQLSAHAALAYVEAEFFGGSGTQAHARFADGRASGPLVVSDHAINEALRHLGVAKGDAFDEFEAIGLDQHRDTDRWLA
ncbi:TPA: hypothetical protein QDC27_001215 [Burkholderia cepacia ATCC 25416]|uniref:Uncharacterized protein n=2 Tax=Burkholderia cepacia TaxID=292 RepID=A0AAE8T3G2_BURCE|nr:hypothetical protein [Burkholderia cepacia]HDR9765661.1 hypothetical protein [Burkholderia cepacia ATCC 25416]KVA24531.1 hypothetical protein WI44_30315 [Burkholderia cepacia]KVA48951.1 hypothetical protein WI45_06930 [Burkholderia cepacia]KVE88759.1 hypothetical protein WI99_07675 [Burkholderia cepacia]KVH64866.1 hypothetical protein WJ40_14975 [Burkholderia cepacia]